MPTDASSINVTSTPNIIELSRSQGGVIPSVTSSSNIVSEVIKDQSLEDKSDPVVSTLTAAAPVFGPTADSFTGSRNIEGIEKTIPSIAPSSQPPPSYSSPPISQSISSYPSESMQVKRQGRKTPARVEAPRRRGKKQALVAPPLPDGSAVQDQNSSLQSQNRSVESVGTKAISLRSQQGTDTQEQINVIQAQASEVHSPGGLAGHEPKRKERSVNAAQNKQPTSLSARLDSSSGTLDKTSALGRIQTANVNDVARVMKEVFSGTCSSKARNVEPFGSEGRDVSKVAVSSKTSVEVTKSQSSEDKACSALPAMEMAAPASVESQSETKADGQFEDENAPLMSESSEDKACSALPTMETAAPASDESQSETKADGQFEDANPPVMSESLLRITTGGNPQSDSAAGSVDKVEGSGQLLDENSTMPSKMESICAALCSVGQTDDDTCQRAPIDGDMAGFSTGPSSGQVTSSLACPVEVEPPVVFDENSVSKTESAAKESPESSSLDVSGLMSPAMSMKADDDKPTTLSTMEAISTDPLDAGQNDVDPLERAPLDGDLAGFNTEVSSNPVGSSLVCPVAVEPPVASDDNSAKETESSIRLSPNSSPLDIGGLVYSTITMKTNDAGDNPETTLSDPTNPDHTDTVKSPSMTRTSSGNKIESFVQVPLTSSDDIKSPEVVRELTKSDDVCDHLKVTSPFPESADNSGLVVVPHVAEIQIKSRDKIECSVKESSESSHCHVKSTEYTTSPLTADHPREAALMFVTTDSFSVVDPPGVIKVNCENIVEPLPKESAKYSPLDSKSFDSPTPLPASPEDSGLNNFSCSVSDKSDLPSVKAEADECFGEAVFEGMEISQKDTDPGVVLGPAGTAPGYNSLMSDEAPSDKGQVDAPYGGDEDEVRLETVHSIVAESVNAELVPKDEDSPLVPDIQSSGGNCVEVCNMEVDLPEGLSEKDPVSHPVTLEDSERPQAEMSDAIDASQVGLAFFKF